MAEFGQKVSHDKLECNKHEICTEKIKVTLGSKIYRDYHRQNYLQVSHWSPYLHVTTVTDWQKNRTSSLYEHVTMVTDWQI